MNKHTPKQVQAAYEHYIRSYNAHDNQAYWACFHWPHTCVLRNNTVAYEHPTYSLTEIKHQRGWVYQQIISLQVVAYSMYTAHVVVRLVCLDVHKKPIRECDMVYIYKKILDEWKIYVISEADDMQRDTTVSVEA